MKQLLLIISIAFFSFSCKGGAKSDQDKAQNLYNQSIQYQDIGDMSQAEEKITEAIKLKIDPIYIRKRIDIYLAESKHDLAYSDLSCLRDSNWLENHDIANLIMVSYVMENSDESLLYCNQRIKRNNKDYYALYYRAVNNEKLLKYKNALDDLNFILAHAPSDYYGAYLERGNIYAILGFREKAIDDYLKYIDFDNYNNIVYSNLGRVYFGMGLSSDALKYYKEALKRKQTEAGAQNMALYYEDRGDYSRALDYYTMAIEQNGNSAFSYLGKGELFLKMAKKQEAKASFAKAERIATSLLDKNDRDVTIFLVRANAYKNLGETEKSDTDYRTVDSIYTDLIKEFPTAPRLYRLRGEMFLQCDKFEKAYEDLDKSYKMDSLMLYTKKLRDRAKANLP